MNEEHRKAYLEKYKSAKERGVKFFPDIIYKDSLIMFGLFVLLVALAIFVGVANEPPADPNDSSYIPRPEWYFLWLFQLLKYFPGQIEWVGTTLLPGVLVLALFLLPFYDRSPFRHWRKRPVATGVMSVIVIGIVALTLLAAAETPPTEEGEEVLANTIGERIVVGGDLYGIYCVECHGPDGEGGEIQGVEGLEGVELDPISSTDVMYTFTDETMYNIIDYGQPDLGMPPFGLGYGGELSRGEITNIVTFMRYTWDDRVEIPEEAAASAVPALVEGEVPSYDVHIQPIVKRYCISCHRPGKENNNYLMATYEEVMTSGDHAPNIIPGDLTNNTILMLHREEIEAGGPMPPTKPLPEDYIEIFERWVLGGAPETAEEAAAASTSGAPAEGGETAPPAESGETPPAGEATPTP